MERLAVLFDLDGVISDTAYTHAMAWKSIFEKFLNQNSLPFPLKFEASDYLHYLDGKARFTGIQSFLESKNIKLSVGQPEDKGLDTIHGIGNAKNALYLDMLLRNGVHIFDDALLLNQNPKRMDYHHRSIDKNDTFYPVPIHQFSWPKHNEYC